MYYHINMDNTFIGDNMELIELNKGIEEAKASYEMAKSEKESAYYKAIIEDLKDEKKQILKKEFNWSC